MRLPTGMHVSPSREPKLRHRPCGALLQRVRENVFETELILSGESSSKLCANHQFAHGALGVYEVPDVTVSHPFLADLSDAHQLHARNRTSSHFC